MEILGHDDLVMGVHDSYYDYLLTVAISREFSIGGLDGGWTESVKIP